MKSNEKIKKILKEYITENNLLDYNIPKGCEGILTPPSANPIKFMGGDNVKIKPNVNTYLDPELINKLNLLSKKFTEGFKIIDGYRESGGAKCSQHFVHKAIDVVLDNPSVENVLKFTKDASEVGFTGIGVYPGKSIHLDVRKNKSVWGDNFVYSGIPGWAKDTLDSHMKGDFRKDSEELYAKNSEKDSEGNVKDKLKDLEGKVKDKVSDKLKDLNIDINYKVYSQIVQKIIQYLLA